MDAPTLAATTKTGTRRVIWTCQRCQYARRIDYTTARRCVGRDKWGAAQYTPARVTRVHADGVERDVSWDVAFLRCPTCARELSGVDVRGRVTEHQCDARCLASKGPVCECACGGKNHGAAYMGGA